MGEYVSSTGSLGLSERPDNRLYNNVPHYVTDPVEVRHGLNQMVQNAGQSGGRISRVVLRAVAGDEAAAALIAGQPTDLEVALPLHELGRRGWLLVFGHNHQTRQPLPGSAAALTEAATWRSGKSPQEHVATAAQAGATHSTTISPGDYSQLEELWRPTFGWSDTDIANFAERLAYEHTRPAAERTVWFSALWTGNVLVSAAMAEALNLPGLRLIESTEWRARPGYEGGGRTTANLALLNAQICSGIDRSGELPLIFAECNLGGAYRAGAGAGFGVPSQEAAPQRHIQNVTVDNGLCDFVFMRLSRTTINDTYSPEACRQLLTTIPERNQ